MHNPAHSAFSSWPSMFAAPETSRQLHVSDTSINLDEMAFHQKRYAEADIRELILRCRERYFFAHELVRPHARLPESLFVDGDYDFANFYLPWAQLCTAYREHFFSPQIELFIDQRHDQLSSWRTFVERECFDRFTGDAAWVRCVLESAHLIEDRPAERELYVGDLFDDIIQDLKERNGNDQDKQN